MGQPGLWAIPVFLVAVLLVGSWLCDRVTGWYCGAEGCTPTSYFPVVAWTLGGIAATLLVAVVVLVYRWETPGARPAWFAVLFTAAATVAAGRWVKRRTTEALDRPLRALTATRDEPADLRTILGEAWEQAPPTGVSPPRRNRRDT